MAERGSGAGFGSLSARAKCSRVGLGAVLAWLAWLSWRWNGAAVGLPVVIGLLIGAIHRLTSLRDRHLARHPAWDRLISLVFAGAVVLCLESLWGPAPRPSAGRQDRTAVVWIAVMAVMLGALERWDARRRRTVAEGTVTESSVPVDLPSDQ